MYHSVSASVKCPIEHRWSFHNGLKCCTYYVNANEANETLDYYDPIDSCVSSDYVECPGKKLGTTCTSNQSKTHSSYIHNTMNSLTHIEFHCSNARVPWLPPVCYHWRMLPTQLEFGKLRPRVHRWKTKGPSRIRPRCMLLSNCLQGGLCLQNKEANLHQRENE